MPRSKPPDPPEFRFEAIRLAKTSGETIVAITGGTCTYDSADGSVKLHARNAKGTEYDRVYELIK